MQHPTTQPTNMKDERRRLHSILLVTVVCSALAAAAAGAGTGSDRPDFPISVADLEARHAQMFARLDSNSDGDITPEEFAAARASGDWQRRWQDGARRWRDGAMRYRQHHEGRGHDDHDAHWANGETARAEFEAAIFALLDTDDDGQLSAAEYSIEKQDAARKKVVATMMFERLDTDANGVLSAEEFPPDRLRNLDADGDGEITRKEMRNGMRKRHADAS